MRPSRSSPPPPWPRRHNWPSGTIAASTGYDFPTFSWSAAAGAASYYLYVLDNTSNQPASFDTATTALVSTSYTPTAALTAGHNFTWYIGAEKSGPNGPIAWSTATFALAALPAPTQFNPPPAGPAQTLPFTFSWSAVVGANHYYLYLLDTTTNQPVNPDINSNIGPTQTTFVATGLTHGHSYTWYIAAVSDNNADFWNTASFSVT